MGMDTSPHDIFLQVGLWKWVFSAHGCAMNLGDHLQKGLFSAEPCCLCPLSAPCWCNGLAETAQASQSPVLRPAGVAPCEFLNGASCTMGPPWTEAWT